LKKTPGGLSRKGGRGRFFNAGAEGNALAKVAKLNLFLRSPSPFILSPPSSLHFDAISPKPKAKADGRRPG
jgi:hypothetical protein